MILHGSRMSKGSLKISYHIIFPWLVFSCNTTTLRDEVNAMSLLPEFQYQTRDGCSKPFIDPDVTGMFIPRIASSDS
jgi:hypothetical protein